jgi:hypothetical protein
MSVQAFSGERYLVFCHLNGTCSLRREAEGATTHPCPDLPAAVNLAHDLKSTVHVHITVYDSTGKVMLQSFA